MAIEPLPLPIGILVSVAFSAVPRRISVASASLAPYTYANHLPSFDSTVPRNEFHDFMCAGVIRPAAGCAALVAVSFWADASALMKAPTTPTKAKRLIVSIVDSPSGTDGIGWAGEHQR